MDRLTATSTAPPPPPNWPLRSLPPPTLINVTRESKRHCRLLPAGTVSLNLTQMADVRDHEGYKKLDYKSVESTEHEFEKWAFQRKRAQKKKKKKKAHAREIDQKVDIEEKKILDPNSFDEMIDAVDTLLASLTSPAETTIEPPTAAKAAATSPTVETIEIAELDAEETAIIRKPSSSTSSTHAETGNKVAEPETTTHTAAADGLAATTSKTIAPTLPIAPNLPMDLDPTTALHSHPPSASERAFASNLSSANHARRKELNALTRFDALTQYGTVAKKKTKLSFREAVNKGFREVFLGEERCW